MHSNRANLCQQADSGRLLGLLALVAALAATLVLGCGASGESAGTDDPSNPSGGFESDDPSYQAGSKDGSGGGSSADAGSATGGSGGSAGSNAGEDGEAERAIEEADIIQMSNGRLYALSQYSGLSVIDVSVRDQLRMLGRFRSSAMPFEMILRGTTVIAMFSSYPVWTYDPATGSYGYDQTSRIVVLDTSNPAAITEIGAFDIPGEISDSRVVGDIFYVVSYENGYCYQCETTPTTTILSLNVADPAQIKQVDREAFTEQSSSYGWGRRSIAVNQDRILVAGVEWNWESNQGHSSIQVVDISDPAGAMELGAKVEVEGQIESRWQMDEFDGTLRVISQEGSSWGSGLVPAVETFEIVSSHEIHPLGRLEMVLPRPENLRSVRFDGERAFAVTFEQTDPLFIIDLSDPANPAQVGELEMPGWLYHMVPRGDRLLALGFDQGAVEGAMAVSLFDISDLTKPTMIDRVNFGGDWASMAEDQDRIHKAFNILEDEGLILVPYSGWSYSSGNEYYCGRYHSGIQLVDFTSDSLTKRGVAAQHGTARRAFLHDQRLFAVSDATVSTFDIADKDAPAPKARLALSHNAVKAQVVGDYLVRIEGDWWTSSGVLSVVPVADPERDQPLGTLDLSALSDSVGECYWSYWGFVYGSTVLAIDSYAVLLWNNSYYYGYGGGNGKTGVAVIDLADPTNPKLLSHKTFDFEFGGWGGYYYGGYGYDSAVMSPGAEYVQMGSTVVLQERPPYSYYDDEATTRPHKLHVLDLSDPKDPSLAATVDLPDALGHTPLQGEGNAVLTSHWEPVPNNPGKVRFFVDRIDVTNPSAPQILAPINVPGSLLARHPASGRITTVDYTREVLPVTDSACYEAYGSGARWNWEDETCVLMHRTLKLVDVQGAQATLRDSLPLDDGNYGQVALGDERIFLVRYGYAYYGYEQGDLRDKLMTLSGMGGGELELSAPAPLADSYYSWSTLVPYGKRVVALGSYPGSVAVFDTTDTLAAPTLVKSEELAGYLYDVTVHGDQAICSLGSFGVQSVSLGD